MATHSSILAGRNAWTEESGRLQSMGAQRVGHDLVTEHTEQSRQCGTAIKTGIWIKEMVEGQLDTHMPKNTFRPLPHTIHRYQLKVNLDLNAAAAAAKSLQSCPTLCNPIDDSPPGSSVHVILQARVLEWGAIAFSQT